MMMVMEMINVKFQYEYHSLIHFNALLIFLGLCTLLHGENQSNETPSRSKINSACIKTIEAIQDDVEKLAPVFPILKEISKVNISSNHPIKSANKNTIYISDSIVFQNNVSIEERGPEPDGSRAGQDFFPKVGSGGINFSIYIKTGGLLLETNDEFSLTPKIPNLKLYYVLEENPKNENLEKAVRGIIVSRVGALKQLLAHMKNEDRDDNEKDDKDHDRHEDKDNGHRGDDKH